MSKSSRGPMDPGPPPGENPRDPGPPQGHDPGPPQEGDPGPPLGRDPGPPRGEGNDPGPPSGPGPGGPPSAVETIKLAWSFSSYARPVSWAVGLCFLSMLVGALLRYPMNFVPMWVDTYLQKGTSALPGQLSIYLLVSLGLASGILAGFVAFLQAWCGHRIGEHVLKSLRSDLFANLEHLGMTRVYSEGAGQFVQRLARDVYEVRELYGNVLIDLTSQLVRGVALLVPALVLEAQGRVYGGQGEGWSFPWITLTLLVAFFAAFPIMNWANKRVQQLAQRTMELGEEVLNQLIEAVGGYRDIVASGHFKRFSSRFDATLVEAEKVSLKTAVWGQGSNMVPSSLMAVLLISPYLLAIQFQLTEVGPVISYVAFLGQALPNLMGIFHGSQQLAMIHPSLHQVSEILRVNDPREQPKRVEVAVIEEEVAEVVEAPKGDIRFENVTLELNGRRVLDRVNFEIPIGKTSALVGQSGAGKTTIFHLLLGLVEPTAGEIFIGDQPLKSYSAHQLKSVLGFIPQNPFIFNWSLRENLELGAPHTPDEEHLQKVVGMAQLEKMIRERSSEGGLEAMAGYMGMRLSGGEKQRIALGRLLLQDPWIVICDEYTANVDVHTATLIQNTLNERFQDRTQIFITHQLFTIRDVDRILLLDRGRIVDVGTHNELSERPGLYRELCRVQNLLPS